MNGVHRGGFFSTGKVLNVRCGGVRWERARTFVTGYIGFLCEWCYPRGKHLG